MNESYSAWKEKRGRKQKISRKYHQLVEKCNSQHVSIAEVVTRDYLSKLILLKQSIKIINLMCGYGTF